jgi:carbon-monoxide dehydrogenase small subunit
VITQEFEFHAPADVSAAVELLAPHGIDGKVLAGGMSLVPAMNLGVARPTVVVSLNRLAGLEYVEEQDESIRIGAMTRHARIESDPVIARAFPLLAKAASCIGDVQVRNRGTIGGSIAHADPAADYLPVMLALGATFRAVGPDGERTVVARDFVLGVMATVLAPGELLSRSSCPSSPREQARPTSGSPVSRGASRSRTPPRSSTATARHSRSAVRRRHPSSSISTVRSRSARSRSGPAMRRGVRSVTCPGRRTTAGQWPPCTPAAQSRPPVRPGEEADMRMPVTVTVNGSERRLEIDTRQNLVGMLREQLGLTGTHVGCSTGNCGACTVVLDGKTVKSCSILAADTDGRDVVTIESLSTSADDLHPVQQAFVANQGLQCGFCTPGMVLSALQLLKESPEPAEAEIRHGIAGNLCRCTGYQLIVRSVVEAAKLMREGAPSAA